MTEKRKFMLGCLCAAVCQVIFGFSHLFTKRVTDSISPMTLLGWRFIFAFAVLNICVLIRVIKVDFNFKRKSVLLLVAVAVFQPVLYYIGETVGISLTSTSESGTVVACIPIITLLCSALLLKEIPAKTQIAGVCVTVSGIIIIVLMKGLEAVFNPIGYAMLALAVVSYSLYSVFSQKANGFTVAEKTYVMMTFGVVAFTSIALIENAIAGTLKEFAVLPFTNFDFLIAVLYLSVFCSVAAFLLYNTAIEYIGASRTASFIGISTIVTVTAGIIILKEKYSILQGLGTVLVIGGVYLANISTEKRTAPRE